MDSKSFTKWGFKSCSFSSSLTARCQKLWTLNILSQYLVFLRYYSISLNNINNQLVLLSLKDLTLNLGDSTFKMLVRQLCNMSLSSKAWIFNHDFSALIQNAFTSFLISLFQNKLLGWHNAGFMCEKVFKSKKFSLKHFKRVMNICFRLLVKQHISRFSLISLGVCSELLWTFYKTLPD